MVQIYIPHMLNYIIAMRIHVFTPLHVLNPPEYKTVKKTVKGVKSSIKVQTIFSLIPPLKTNNHCTNQIYGA